MSRLWIAVLVAMLLFPLLVVGQTRKPSEIISSAAGLRDAAEKTYSNYNRAFQAGTAKVREAGEEQEIPSKYWTDPIIALKPVKVYLHRVNVVVVQS
jgi:hypothetical protein